MGYYNVTHNMTLYTLVICIMYVLTKNTRTQGRLWFWFPSDSVKDMVYICKYNDDDDDLLRKGGSMGSTQFYKEYKEQKITKIFMSMNVWQLFREILRNFHADAEFYLFLRDILFQAVFMLTRCKRINFYCWHFKNFCQNKKR